MHVYGNLLHNMSGKLGFLSTVYTGEKAEQTVLSNYAKSVAS